MSLAAIVKAACTRAEEAAKKDEAVCPVTLALVHPTGDAVLLRAPSTLHRRKDGDWLCVSRVAPNAATWRAVAAVAAEIRQKAPDVDVVCVSYQWAGVEDWAVAFAAKSEGEAA
ncbi:MAG TPA: hypothetical protein VIY73_13340 [Polyangiaceae bacterium]